MPPVKVVLNERGEFVYKTPEPTKNDGGCGCLLLGFILIGASVIGFNVSAEWKEMRAEIKALRQAVETLKVGK